jgi:hypothetical protein
VVVDPYVLVEADVHVPVAHDAQTMPES